jgi:hypothetical protein
MEEFAQHGGKGHKLKKLNGCRIFLGVVNLSEIASLDGKFIKEVAWTGIKDKNQCNHFQWPRLPPSTLPMWYWQLWKKALTKCFLNPMKVAEKELVMLLGDWDKMSL